MAGYNRGDFDRKLEALRRQIIMTEVEVSNRDVAVEGVYQVTTTLVADTTMRDVQVAQRVAINHELREHAARTMSQ